MADEYDLSTDIKSSTEGDDEILSEAEVIRILTRRIPNIGGYVLNPNVQYPVPGAGSHDQSIEPISVGLIRKVASLIPKEMRTKDVLERGDIRSFLAPLTVEPEGGHDYDELSKTGGVEFRYGERQLATEITLAVTETLADEINAQLKKNTEGIPDDDPRKMAMLEDAEDLLHNYQDGIVSESPAVPEATIIIGDDSELHTLEDEEALSNRGGGSELESLGVDVANLDAGMGIDRLSYFSQEDVDQLFETGVDRGASLDQLLAGQASMEDQATDEGTTLMGQEQRVSYNKPGRVTSRVPHGPGLTINQMLQKPTNMNPQQITALSKKMKDAGLYAKAGGEPMIEGDWTDANFMKAYRSLVALSIQKKTPMMDLLTERKSAYSDAVADAMSTRLTDPARLRISADNLSRGLLGRKLNSQEHEQIINFTHDLERRNAAVEAGLDPDLDIPGVDSLDEGVVADIDARMSDYIRENNVEEFSGERVQDQYDMFSGFLAGPGRGGSF